MKPRSREHADTLQDRTGIQNDFDRLQKWSEMKMKFNKGKWQKHKYKIGTNWLNSTVENGPDYKANMSAMCCSCK